MFLVTVRKRADADEGSVMTAVSIERENRIHMDRLYQSYVGLRLTPENETGSRTIPVAHFGAFEVRLIEFVDSSRGDSMYRHDTQSSIDSCLCRDFDEVEDLGEYFISQARGLCESHS